MMDNFVMFDAVTQSYFNKKVYFEQKDGTVYSALSGKYMSLEDAMNEFIW